MSYGRTNFASIEAPKPQTTAEAQITSRPEANPVGCHTTVPELEGKKMPNAENVEGQRSQTTDNTSANLYSSVQSFMNSDTFKSIAEPISTAMNHLPKLELDFGSDSSQGQMKPNPEGVPGGCTGFDGLPDNTDPRTPKASDSLKYQPLPTQPKDLPPSLHDQGQSSGQTQPTDRPNLKGNENTGPATKPVQPGSDNTKEPQPQQSLDKSLPPRSPNVPSSNYEYRDKGAEAKMKKDEQAPILK